MMRNRCVLSVLAVAGAIFLTVFSGCSRSDNRQSIHGTVTLDGQPLAGGIINFRPAKGVEGNTSGTVTDQDGGFSISADKGLMPGKYLVTIQLWRDTNKTFIDEDGKLAKVRAPIPYKESGKLEATIGGDGANQFDFHLTSKP